LPPRFETISNVSDDGVPDVLVAQFVALIFVVTEQTEGRDSLSSLLPRRHQDEAKVDSNQFNQKGLAKEALVCSVLAVVRQVLSELVSC